MGGNKWIFVGKKSNSELLLFQIPYVSIKRHILCKDVNAYDPEAVEYFYKRNINRSKSALLSGKAKEALIKFQKGYCPVCDVSLFNDEELEIHHVLPRRDGGDHSLKNLKLLHRACHKQVEYSKNGNLRAV